MTETKYLKIISDLFRLTGYATGIIKGLSCGEAPDGEKSFAETALRYLEEQQNLILQQLEKTEQCPATTDEL